MTEFTRLQPVQVRFSEDSPWMNAVYVAFVEHYYGKDMHAHRVLIDGCDTTSTRRYCRLPPVKHKVMMQDWTRKNIGKGLEDFMSSEVRISEAWEQCGWVKVGEPYPKEFEVPRAV